MKIRGKKIEGPNREIIAIPRGDGDDIIFIVQAVLSMTPFEKMCPEPQPPKRTLAGGAVSENSNDPEYLRQLDVHNAKRLAWLVITSLEATEELEWEKVVISDQSTWILFREEMRESGFNDTEINRVVAGVASVNALSEEKIEEARERFLLSQQAQQDE